MTIVREPFLLRRDQKKAKNAKFGIALNSKMIAVLSLGAEQEGESTRYFFKGTGKERSLILNSKQDR